MSVVKKKVLLFLQSNVGGAERVTVTIGKNLDANIFDVCFYAVGSWDCKIADFIPSQMFRGHIKQKNPFRLILNLYRCIRKESPDIVFSSTMYISTKVLLLKCFFPMVRFIVRSENNFFKFSLKQKLMIRLLYRRAETIIAQTEEMRMELIKKAKLTASNIYTIQNPQDFVMIDGLAQVKSPFLKKNTINYVASGRFAPAKGFDILVRAFALVEKRINNVELYIVGQNSGPNEEYFLRIDQLIKELNLSEKIHCVGYQKNPYAYVKNADCFVLSSRNEGLPNVLIEALYLGTPAAATTCIPAIERIIEKGKTGFLAVSENAESLAEAMIQAASLGRITSNTVLDTMPAFNALFRNGHIK